MTDSNKKEQNQATPAAGPANAAVSDDDLPQDAVEAILARKRDMMVNEAAGQTVAENPADAAVGPHEESPDDAIQDSVSAILARKRGMMVKQADEETLPKGAPEDEAPAPVGEGNSTAETAAAANDPAAGQDDSGPMDAVTAILARKKAKMEGRDAPAPEPERTAPDPAPEQPANATADTDDDAPAGPVEAILARKRAQAAAQEAEPSDEGDAAQPDIDETPEPTEPADPNTAIEAILAKKREEAARKKAEEDAVAAETENPETLAEGEDGDRADAEAVEDAMTGTRDGMNAGPQPVAGPRPASTRELVAVAAGPSVGPVALYLVIALVAALIMGAAVSYRHEAAQRQLIGRFTASIDTLEGRLASMQQQAALAPATRTPEPKSLDDYALILNGANQLFEKGHFRDAAGRYRSALRGFPSGSLTDQAHYRLGVCMLRTGRAETAANHFRVVTASFPNSRYYARAALELSHVLMGEQQYAQARRVLYQIVGARARLQSEDAETLEKAYYAIARTLEGEADVIERLDAVQTAGLQSAEKTGDMK